MMTYGYDHFNAEPIMLRHSSSLATADDKMFDIYAADQVIIERVHSGSHKETHWHFY